MNTRDYFAQRIAELRNEKGVTQSEVADALGISRQSVTLYENHSRVPDVEVLARYASYLGTTSDYLLGLSDNRTADAAAIGDRTGLNDDAIECLEMYARANKLLLQTNEKDKTLITTDMAKGIICQVVSSEKETPEDSDSELYAIFKRLSEHSRYSWGSVGIELLASAETLRQTINHILCDIDMLKRLGDYLFAEYGNAARHIDASQIDEEMTVMLTLAYKNMDNFYDPEFLERSRLLYLEDALKLMREEIIKQQEETNAKENKRQE